MTNNILRRGLQLLGRKSAVESYRDLGWELYNAEGLCPEDWPEHRPPDEETCPSCGKRAITALRHVWESEDTDDYWNVYHFWCARQHMWVDAVPG